MNEEVDFDDQLDISPIAAIGFVQIKNRRQISLFPRKLVLKISIDFVHMSVGWFNRMAPMTNLRNYFIRRHRNLLLVIYSNSTYFYIHIFQKERCNDALLPPNRDKNRYANVLPYDFNRVHIGKVCLNL